jgi:hypothetical protein
VNKPSQSLLKTMLQCTMKANLIVLLQGCAVVAVVATGVSVTASAVGAVANAIIPDGDDD